MLRIVDSALGRALLRTRPVARRRFSGVPDTGGIVRRDGTTPATAPGGSADGVLPEFPGRSPDQLAAWRKGKFPPEMVPRELQPVSPGSWEERVHAQATHHTASPTRPLLFIFLLLSQTLSARVSTLSFNLIVGVLLAGMGVLYMLLKDDDVASHLARMKALSEELRVARTEAAAALADVAWETGSIPLRRGKELRFVAVGPADADRVVLLHAEDWEGSPAVWGAVVAQLARQLRLGPPPAPPAHSPNAVSTGADAGGAAASAHGPSSAYRRRLAELVGAPAVEVGRLPAATARAPAGGVPPDRPSPGTSAGSGKVRIIAFGRANTPPPAANTGAAPGSRSDAPATTPSSPARAMPPTPAIRNSASLSLRMLDVKALWRHFYGGGDDGAASQGPRQVVLVTQGDGTWGDLALAGRAGEPGLPRVDCMVAVSPTVMNRGAGTIWMDAVVRHSALAAAAAPAVTPLLGGPPTDAASVPPLELLLAPPVDPAEWPELAPLVAALREQATAKRDGQELSPNEMRAILRTALKVVGERVELLREHHATEPIVTEYEAELLLQLLRGNGMGFGMPVVALVLNPDALPTFVTPAQRVSIGTWLMHAANTIGVAMMHPSRQAALAAQRLDMAPTMACEMTGMPKEAFLPTPAPPSTSLPSPTPSIANQVARAPESAAAEPSGTAAEPVPRLGRASGTLPSASSLLTGPPAASLFTFSMGHTSSAAAMAISAAPMQHVKEGLLDRFVTRARRVLGWQDTQTGQQPSVSLRYMQREADVDLDLNVSVHTAPLPGAAAAWKPFTRS